MAVQAAVDMAPVSAGAGLSSRPDTTNTSGPPSVQRRGIADPSADDLPGWGLDPPQEIVRTVASTTAARATPATVGVIWRMGSSSHRGGMLAWPGRAGPGRGGRGRGGPRGRNPRWQRDDA